MTGAGRARKNSPILGAARATIGEASNSLVSAASEFNHSFEVDLALVRPDPDQPRRHFDPDALAALAATLQTEGQLQPVLLRPDPEARGRWIIVAGERRWRAAQLNGWTKLLAIVHHGDPDITSLIENLQRVDLSPLEEARGINRLLTEKGWTQEHAARALGRATSDLSGTLRILRLPEALLSEILTSEHPPAKNVLIELARIEDPAALRRLAGLARDGRLTVKAIREAGRAPRSGTDDRFRAHDEPPAPTHPIEPREVEPHPVEPQPAPAAPQPNAAPDWTVVVGAIGVLSAVLAEQRDITSAEARTLWALKDVVETALRRHRI